MSRKCFVFSTATTSVSFVEYGEARPNRFPEVKRRVTILGGANVPAKTLVTPRGVVTAVSEDEAAFLATNRNFAKMMANGFMTLASDDKDLERALLDMKPKDRCAPKVAADFVKPPKVGAAAA